MVGHTAKEALQILKQNRFEEYSIRRDLAYKAEKKLNIN